MTLQLLSYGTNCQQRLLLVIIWNHLKRIVTVIFITDNLFLYQNSYVRFPLIEVVHTIQYNTIQYNTIQYNIIQYNTIQYNTIQYNTIQYNTIQYNTKQKNKKQ